jgi:hypothetical protein
MFQPWAHTQSVDISESGISAMLGDEVLPPEVVRLEFTIPTGDVAIHALVRQRNAASRPCRPLGKDSLGEGFCAASVFARKLILF